MGGWAGGAGGQEFFEWALTAQQDIKVAQRVNSDVYFSPDIPNEIDKNNLELGPGDIKLGMSLSEVKESKFFSSNIKLSSDGFREDSLTTAYAYADLLQKKQRIKMLFFKNKLVQIVIEYGAFTESKYEKVYNEIKNKYSLYHYTLTDWELNFTFEKFCLISSNDKKNVSWMVELDEMYLVYTNYIKSKYIYEEWRKKFIGASLSKTLKLKETYGDPFGSTSCIYNPQARVSSLRIAQADSTEVSFWESVRDSKIAGELEAYLKAYPTGKFVPLARMRIERLKGAGASGEGETKKAASEQPPAHECDRQAAQEGNRDNPGPFVHFPSIDPAKAIPACREAVRAFPTARRFPFQLARALQVAGKYSEAEKLYRKLAEAKYPPGMNGLGSLYLRGSGVRKDATRGAELIQRAADLGNPLALANIGMLYGQGRGVEKDTAKGRQLLLAAAKQGHSMAHFRLGVVYDKGIGVSEDAAQAIEWFRKAAEKDNPFAMNNLGFMYENGNGVAKDTAKAVRWYRKAAEKGYARGMYNLGVSYDNGRGVTKDAAEAVKWYRKAAEKGQEYAMNKLGFMYEVGQGVAKDQEEAVKWYRKAAEKGQEYAIKRLGVLGVAIPPSAPGKSITSEELGKLPDIEGLEKLR